jgi:threonine synthase
MAGVQPRHYNALEMALQRGLATEDELASLPFDNVPPTILVKLQHTILPDGAEALASIRDSGGALVTVSDDEALEAQARLGAVDGLYVEPSSAVILPAIEQLRREGRITAGQTVVACITGSGFRETTVSMALRPPHPITITPEEGLRIFATFAQHPSHAFGTIVGR